MAPGLPALTVTHQDTMTDHSPETIVPTLLLGPAENVVSLSEANLLETAFLAHFPDHFTLETFRSAANGSMRIQKTDVLDRIPLNTAGDLLTAGSGIFFVFVLGIGLVEQLRLAYQAP